MNSWQGSLLGSLGITALVGAGFWHANDSERQCPPSLDGGAAMAPFARTSVSRVYWSADGRALLALSRGEFDISKRLSLYDTAGKSSCLPLATEAIECASLARDGLRVLYGTGSGQLIWMDAQSADPVMLLELPILSTFTATAIADDGSQLAGGTNTGTIYLCEPAGKNCTVLPARLQSSVADLRFSTDGQRLLSAHCDGRIIVWDLPGGKMDHEFVGHEQPAMAAAFLPDGKQIVSAGLDDTLRIWDQMSGREMWRRNLGLGEIKGMAVSPDGVTAACGGFARKIVVWDLLQGEKKFEIDTPASVIFHLTFSPDGTLLAAAGKERTIRLYDARTGAEQPGIDIDDPRIANK